MKVGLSFIFVALVFSVSSVSSAAAKEPSLLPKNDFGAEQIGTEPTSLKAVVGDWRIGKEKDNAVLVVDGSKWQEGKASGGVAEKAKSLYGARYAEFLDNVKAYAYFPFAVATYVDDFRGGEISVRFKAISGKIDQAAGIIFDGQPNGDYLILRANALEDNVILFKFEHGKRSFVKRVADIPTPKLQWHELRMVLKGRDMQGYLNGKLVLEHTLDHDVSGKVGLWSKADSVVQMDDFTVLPTSIASK
jgi:hypothetical protein